MLLAILSALLEFLLQKLGSAEMPGVYSSTFMMSSTDTEKLCQWLTEQQIPTNVIDNFRGMRLLMKLADLLACFTIVVACRE